MENSTEFLQFATKSLKILLKKTFGQLNFLLISTFIKILSNLYARRAKLSEDNKEKLAVVQKEIFKFLKLLNNPQMTPLNAKTNPDHNQVRDMLFNVKSALTRSNDMIQYSID